MGPWLVAVLAVVALAVVAIGLAALRRARLLRDGVEASLRRPARRASGRRQPRSRGAFGWTLGVLRRDRDRLLWFRAFSVSPRPRRSWQLAELTVAGTRQPRSPENLAVPVGADVVRCRTAAGEFVELALAPADVATLRGWLARDGGQPA